jgi:hypothetical protein
MFSYECQTRDFESEKERRTKNNISVFQIYIMNFKLLSLECAELLFNHLHNQIYRYDF